jgi:hypothetical protein
MMRIMKLNTLDFDWDVVYEHEGGSLMIETEDGTWEVNARGSELLVRTPDGEMRIVPRSSNEVKIVAAGRKIERLRRL